MTTIRIPPHHVTLALRRVRLDITLELERAAVMPVLLDWLTWMVIRPHRVELARLVVPRRVGAHHARSVLLALRTLTLIPQRHVSHVLLVR